MHACRESSCQGHRLSGLLVAVCLLAACASPRPVLYPNSHLENVGAEASQREINECVELAKAADLEKSRAGETAKKTGGGAVVGAAVGAAVGAVTGRPGTGAAAGAAGGGVGGFFRGLFGSRDPDPVYKRYVETCLRERGYEPIGWK